MKPAPKAAVAVHGKATPTKPSRPSEHEKPLSLCVEDFLAHLEADRSSLDGWAVELVEKFSHEIKEKIRLHWKESAKTRRMFTNVPSETVWEDEATKTMILSRRNFSLFDPTFLPILEDYILSDMKRGVEGVRSQIRSILKAVYADETEVNEVEEQIHNTEPSGYSFSEYGRHFDLLKKWSFELKNRFPVIEYCRAREQFMLQLIKWEDQNKNLVTAKGTSSILRWVPQFRNDVIRIYKESSATSTKLLSQAESKLGKPVKVHGVLYSEIFQKQEAQLSRAKTSFSNFKHENLFFLRNAENPGQETIAERVLDQSIEHILTQSDALPLPSQPPMPLHAAEVKFHFDYY